MSETKVPSIPAPPNTFTPQERAFLMALKELVEVRDGKRGDTLDANITFRDLLGDAGTGLDTSRAGKPKIIKLGGTTLDSTIPPAVTGFQATGAYSTVILSWDELLYRNHAYVEVWRNIEDNLGLATLLGTTEGEIYSDSCGESKAYYYWVRAVSTSDIKGPYNALHGLLGETSPDVPYLIDILTGQLAESSLSQSLQDRIALIDAPEGVLNSVSNKVATLRNALTPRVSIAESRLEVIEATDRNIIKAIESITVVNSGQTSDIYLEQQARVNADEAQAIEIKRIEAKGDDGFAQVNSRVNVLETRDVTLASKIDQIIVANTSQTSDIYLEQQARISGDATNASLIQSVRSSFDSAIADVTSKIDTLSSIDTSLASKVDSIIVTNSGQTSDIYLEQVARVAADGALASQISFVSAAVDTATAKIGAEETARATADDALATATGDLRTEFETNSATVTSSLSSLTTATSALSTASNTLKARVDGVGGVGIEQAYTAQATTNGVLNAQYTVKVNNTSNKWVTGFGLAQTTVDGQTVGEFTIIADKFSIAPTSTDPNAANGAPFYHIATGQVINGVNVPAGTYMKAAFISDASITRAKIGLAAIDTARIDDLAVTSAKINDLDANKITFDFATGKYLSAAVIVGGDISGTEIHGNHIWAGGTSENPNIELLDEGAMVAYALPTEGQTVATRDFTTFADGQVSKSFYVPNHGYTSSNVISQVESGSAQSGTSVILAKFYKTIPTVMVSPNNIKTFSPDFFSINQANNAAQSIQVTGQIERLSNDRNSIGYYQMRLTPRATLTIDATTFQLPARAETHQAQWPAHNTFNQTGNFLTSGTIFNPAVNTGPYEGLSSMESFVVPALTSSATFTVGVRGHKQIESTGDNWYGVRAATHTVYAYLNGGLIQQHTVTGPTYTITSTGAPAGAPPILYVHFSFGFAPLAGQGSIEIRVHTSYGELSRARSYAWPVQAYGMPVNIDWIAYGKRSYSRSNVTLGLSSGAFSLPGTLNWLVIGG